MKKNLLRLAATTLLLSGSLLPVVAQTTVYEVARSGSTTSGTNNPDFTLNGFSSTLSANKSTAPGIPAGSTSSRIASTGNPPAHAGTNFVLSPNNTIAGQLVSGTTYAVAITFGSTGNNESSDLVVATSDTQTTGNDTFAGTSTAFQSGNGYNQWITIGNITVNGPLPTLEFAYLSGTNNRWYVDTVRFTSLPPLPTAQYWDTGSPGGSGTWDTTSANWNTLADGTGTQGIYVQANLADFGGTAGTVSIDPVNGITTDGGLEFDTTGYTIQSGPLTLGNGTNIAVVGASTVATINSVIAGNNGMATTGLGTLVLNNTNNLTATVSVNTGVLSLGTNITFTSLGGNPSGTLQLNTNTLSVGDANNTTCSAVIADAGASTPGYIIKQGSGVLSLNGKSTFHGTATINAGALSVSSDAGFGSVPAAPFTNEVILNNGGRLDFPAVFTMNANRGIYLGAGGGMLSTPGSGTTTTIAGPISGSGSLSVPSGGLDLKSTNNTFSPDIS